MDYDSFRKELVGYQHYTGEMGDFWYDPDEFGIQDKEFVVDDDRKWLSYTGNKESITIPEGVSVLKLYHEQYGKRTLTVNLPDSVEEAGFFDYSDIESFSIRSHGDKFKILLFDSASAFLRKIEIPDSVEQITTLWSRSLEEIKLPPHLKILENKVFSSCVSLKKIELPDTVEQIGENAFESCTGLEEIRLPSHLKILKGQTFLYCSALTEIEIPDSVEEIGNGAFKGCSSLKKIVLPKHFLGRLSPAVFAGCSRLDPAFIKQYTR